MRSFDYTVLGANGFIGSHLVRQLSGKSVLAPARDEMPAYFKYLTGKSLGKVFYCIGMTANFRNQPFATVDANLVLLRHILEHCEFDRLVYLSSTRVYSGIDNTDEISSLCLNPQDPDHLYNLSKVMAESLCLSSSRNVCIARLSNVYGEGMQSHNFLASLLCEASQSGYLFIRTAPGSVKDYIAVDDVVRYLVAMADSAKDRLYNVASGVNVSHVDLAEVFREAGIEVEFLLNAALIKYPRIRTNRLITEFGEVKCNVLSDLADFLQYKKISTYTLSKG